jgi:L-lactate dehydrogenase complex protein LldG
LTILTQTPETAASATHRQELASASIGLTGADAGLAETGSIVVTSGPGRGRLASLLPRVHVAIVRRSSIVESLPVLIARRPELVTSGANFVCITGPSRTADIEHVLARGVHGPGEVHAILVD